jgi:DNA-binding HxlR family transcriptional regulator
MSDRSRDPMRQIRELESRLENLRKEVERHREEGEDVLAFLDEPRSFQQLMTATGDDDEKSLINRLNALEEAGKVERWDLPRWVRSDVQEKAKARQLFSETPLRQRDMEIMFALQDGREDLKDVDRRKASDRIQHLKREGLIQLGDKKGDPWYMPPMARGTKTGVKKPDLDAAPDDGGRYQLHRSRRGRKTSGPPKRGPRVPKGGT